MFCNFKNGVTRRRLMAFELGLFVITAGLCLVVVFVLSHGLRSLLLGNVGFNEGMVFVNGTTSIGLVDEDFICATLDWWPPQKCDYGTFSWGSSSILNLVSVFLFWFLRVFVSEYVMVLNHLLKHINSLKQNNAMIRVVFLESYRDYKGVVR